jgi:cystathionine gamma-synthase
MKKSHDNTIAAQLLGHVDPHSAGVTPSLQMSTTFVRDAENALVRPDNSYGRDQNEGVRLAEDVIAALEGAEDVLLFPSGMAAIAAIFQALPTGSRVLVQSGIYWGTLKFIGDHAVHLGMDVDFIDTSDEDALDQVTSNYDLVFIETPSNPWLKVTDMADIRKRFPNAFLVVDSTAATPMLTKPIVHGADIVVHSATKALNGHSDVLAGVLCCASKDDLWTRIAQNRQVAGAIIGAFEAWMLMRSLRTLPIRVERMCDNALTFARHFEQHSAVEAVWYPGLASHPHAARVKRQMPDGGGYLMSLLVKGGRQSALDVISKLTLFHRATSLGGVESLVEHRHTIEPHTGIPENLIRISIGVEKVEDLIADFEQALAHHA